MHVRIVEESEESPMMLKVDAVVGGVTLTHVLEGHGPHRDWLHHEFDAWSPQDIVASKRVHPIHGLQYEVHWKGHSRGESTWEIARYVKNAARKIAEFEARSEKWHRTHKTRNNLEHAVSSAEESPESGSDDNEPLRIACNRGMKRPRTSK